MSLATMIEDLINDIGTGLNEAAIRNRLLTLREQAEAQDTRLKELEANVVELEAKSESENLVPQEGKMAEDTIKVLRLLFDHDLTLSQIAHALGISEGMADYHCGVLRDRLMIQFPAFGMMGIEPALYITQSGREYLVSLGLV
jgi:hypothetical protein